MKNKMLKKRIKGKNEQEDVERLHRDEIAKQ